MTYSSTVHRPSPVELAQSGNFRAIAHWLNLVLMPSGARALVGGAKPGCLKILIELQPFPEYRRLSSQDQDSLTRFVCHRIWQLNSALIEGVRVAVRIAGEPGILWERSVRIASPARQHKRQRSRQLHTKIRHTARRKSQLKTMRMLLISGSTVFAFMVGGILAYTRAPVDRSSAVTSPPVSRPDTVRTALEVVPVVKHTQLTNPSDPSVSLLFGGDVTLSDSFAETIGKDYRWAFAELNEYRQADLAMVNLENPLTKAPAPIGGKAFNFKADPESVQVLKEGGVDLVNLANNHTMDFKAAGLLETTKTLDDAGILRVGAGSNIAEARRPQIVDVKGQRIAYLGYYGEEYAASADKPGTSPIAEDRIAQDIRSIRSQVDWVVVNYHWGQEQATHPAAWQVNLAHYTIDQGADLVVGHHSHVLQGAEIYKGRPIAYSLGNFIFGGKARDTYDTAVLKVALKDKQMKVEFLPVEVRKFQPKVVSGDRAEAILKQIDDRSTEFQQPMRSPVVLDARQIPVPEATSPLMPQPTTPAETPAGQSAPTPPNPGQSAPAQPDPVQTSPTQTSPTQTSPAQPSPTQTSPTQTSPAQPSPTQTSPTQTSPTPQSETAPTPPEATPPAPTSDSTTPNPTPPNSGGSSSSPVPPEATPTLQPTPSPAMPATDSFTNSPNRTPITTPSK